MTQAQVAAKPGDSGYSPAFGPTNGRRAKPPDFATLPQNLMNTVRDGRRVCNIRLNQDKVFDSGLAGEEGESGLSPGCR